VPLAPQAGIESEMHFMSRCFDIHVFCLQGELGGERFARHWYDLVQLNKAGIVDAALKDRNLANSVAAHKSVFFPEKDASGTVIDYAAAVTGGLKLVPMGEGRVILAADYRKMLDDGLLPDGSETFDKVLTRCADIEARANKP
jgi:hypothetical protein